MGISIPIGRPSEAAPTTSTGISIPIGIGAQGVRPADRESHVLRAVAAAAALQKPAEALDLAKQIADDPSAIAEFVVDPGRMKVVFDAIDRRFVDATGAPTPSVAQTAAAAATGADARLVAAAQAALKDNDEAATHALRWVAAIDVSLLAPAARAGVRRLHLEQVPKPNQLGRLAQIEARLAEVEGRLPPRPPEVRGRVAAEVK